MKRFIVRPIIDVPGAIIGTSDDGISYKYFSWRVDQKTLDKAASKYCGVPVPKLNRSTERSSGLMGFIGRKTTTITC